ncbi:hypothetical protein E2C01_086942 [Portunus trituberculatus]|uniref:Uncharacterized protein n=1 Tax=Portunus trituberculatus TaxID=210409 RepID=A0A5B7J576_PORTR|nr:hypothetical protein [Portunus trituberculatus]
MNRSPETPSLIPSRSPLYGLIKPGVRCGEWREGKGREGKGRERLLPATHRRCTPRHKGGRSS